MKITIVLGAFLPVPAIMGGALEKVWLALAREFSQRGREVVMISRAIPPLRSRETDGNLRHVRIAGFDAPRSLVWLKVLDLIYSVRVLFVLPRSDIIVTNTFWLPLLLGWFKRGLVYVHVARFPKWQMRLYGRAARLQAPSQAVGQAIARSAPGLFSKITVIPYPAPVSVTGTEPPSLREREKVILFVGRVHPEKGVHLLVDAFAGVARTVFADWKLMIVGPAETSSGGGGKSYFASLQQLAQKAQNQIVFAGPVFDPVELEKTFLSARLFVYPSLAEQGESFGLAPLEAMTHGCAVLVSNLSCFHDFVRDGQTGFIFDHRSSDPGKTLRDKIQNVVSEEESLARIASRGYRQSAEYSVARIADRFLNDFDSLNSQSHAGTG